LRHRAQCADVQVAMTAIPGARPGAQSS
jgi:hypothetical protein